MKALYDFFSSFLSWKNNRMVIMFPRIPRIARTELVSWVLEGEASIARGFSVEFRIYCVVERTFLRRNRTFEVLEVMLRSSAMNQ